MRMVADSNFLRSEELRAYLSRSRFNKVVVCDFVELEMLKGDSLTTIMESTKILADYPKQVVLAKQTATAARLRGKKKGAKKRLSDDRRSREFREWRRKRAGAGRGNEAFEAEILAGGKRAAEQLAEMTQGAGDFAKNLREFRENFSAEEMRILREHEPIPQELVDKFMDIIFQMAARFFELGGLKSPPAKELPHTFVSHFTVCAFAHGLQWNAMGGAEKPEKLVNDLIDVNIATFATFFDGFMSADARALAICKNANFLLKFFADQAPRH
jgi:hypothetical protein